MPLAAQSWQRLDHMGPLSAGMPLLLTDGTVIVHQQGTRDWYKLTPDDFGSYQHGTWSAIARLPVNYGPLYYASAVLADGRVVAIGGEYNFGGQNWTSRGAIYDPVADRWQPLGHPAGWARIGDAPCAVLADGRFLLGNPFSTETAVLDPATLTWTLFGTGKADVSSEESWTLLPDGSVLTADVSAAPGTERFLPTLGTWISAGSTPASLVTSFEVGPAVLRPDGTVFATGATGHTAIYTPPISLTGSGSWAAGPDFPVIAGRQYDIADGPACLLPSGNVLCAASPGIFSPPTRFFEFDGTSLFSVPRPPPAISDPSFNCNLLVLPNGQVLFTDFSSDVELYTPIGSPDPAWRPTITSYPMRVVRGETYRIEGTQFNGLSQACMYGDDSANATNYPLVRLTSLASGHVHFARTFDHSTMAVATGSLPTSTSFMVPAPLSPGDYLLEVVANGIASAPLPLLVLKPLTGPSGPYPRVETEH